MTWRGLWPRAGKPGPPPAEKIPRQKDAYWRLVDNLENRLDQLEADQARAELLKIHLETTPKEIRLWTSNGAIENALVRGTGRTHVFMVAGAGIVCNIVPIELRRR